MLTAEFALTRDSLKRARGASLGLLAAFTAIFTLINAATSDNSLLTNSLQMHHIILMLTIIGFYSVIAMTLCDTASNSFRLQLFTYRLPRSTPWIVAWQMIIAMTVTGATHFTLACLARLCWNFDWPLFTLTAVMMTIAACAVAIIFLFENMQIVQLSVHTVVVLGIWRWTCAQYVPRGYYQYWEHNPDAFIWHTLELTDALTLTAITGVAFAVGVFGASRNRRGEGLNWENTKQALIKQWDRLPWRQRPFTSRLRAQLWFEWRTNGSSAVVTAILGGLVFNTIYLFGGITPDELLVVALNGCLFGPIFCTTLIAFGYSHFDTDLRTQRMSLFRATQPVSDTRMLFDVLSAALLCWLGVWVVAAVGFTATCATVVLTGHSQNVTELFSRFWLQIENVGLASFGGFYVLLLVKGWIGLTYTGTWILWGRPRILIAFAGAAFVLFFAVMISRGQSWLPPTAFDFIKTNLVFIAALPLTLLTPAAFFFAIKKQLIDRRTLALTLLVGVGVFALATWVDYHQATLRETNFTDDPSDLARHLASWLTLTLATVFPIPAAPLALAANRHR